MQGDALREPLPDADPEPEVEYVAPTVKTVADGDCVCDALGERLPEALVEEDSELDAE